MSEAPIATSADSDPAASKKEAKKAKAAAKAEKVAKAQAKKAEKPTNVGSSDGSPTADNQPAKKKDIRLKQEFVNPTARGEKKDLSQPMAAAYDPPAVEAAWYDWWEKKGFFQPPAQTSPDEKKFIIVIPPPNVTGALHLGHALTNSIEDVLVRWHRMNGDTTLWVPGLDHAGIATQDVVEKRLIRELGKSRFDFGREAFVAEVWKWKDQYGNRITSQLRRLGSSTDWQREVFTLDQKLSKAVTEAFVRLYDEGLIYRASRMVNWCCRLKTAISDIEVKHVEFEKPRKISVPGYDRKIEFGYIENFVYKLDGEEGEIEVATTRLETMLGDTAVAVHPDDPRYKHLHGKFLVHPFCNRKIPIITDAELVKMEFGTGAVKVTPAHDPNDNKCGKRNGLEFINIFTDDGLINSNGGQFVNQKRFDARYSVRKALEELGLYRGRKENVMAIGFCSRTDDVIEPMIKPQWWVNCDAMAKEAAEAVRSGQLEIAPDFHKATWFRWLDNIQDWCISRQLWWGHRVPTFLISIDGKQLDSDDSKNWVAGRNEAEAHQKAVDRFGVSADRIHLTQDEDVLDTWFSAALFPFSVFGWPEETADFRRFYPTTILETGHDILFFWVARMVMMGLKLTGRLPFKQVLLHALVRDAQGRKMSKSKGNVIDPIDIIEGIRLEDLHQRLLNSNLDPEEIKKAQEGQRENFPSGISECGTDAMRFTLAAYTSQGRDINLDISRVIVYRNFCNKLWNATKYALMKLGDGYKPQPLSGLDLTHSTAYDRWILSRLNAAIKEAIEGLQTFDFTQSTNAIFKFWLYELCDVYLEVSKPIFADESDQQLKHTVQAVLYICFETGLRLLHPYMPFVTEELWQRLPHLSDAPESIMIARYPTAVENWAADKLDADVQLALQIVHEIRSLTTSYGIASGKKVTLTLRLHDDVRKQLEPIALIIKVLGSAEAVHFIQLTDEPPESSAVVIINEACQLFLHLKGMVNVDAEIQKLEKKISQLEAQIVGLQKKIESTGYQTKVSDELQAKDKAKIESSHEEIRQARLTIAKFQSLK